MEDGQSAGISSWTQEQPLAQHRKKTRRPWKTGKTSNNTFMFADKQTCRATKTMLLKHKLCPTAKEMNIVPGLHTTLISEPKLANAGYTTIFEHDKATIYDATTTTIQANNQPNLKAPSCASTGLWKLQLNPSDQPEAQAIHNLQSEETLYAIFDLPSSQQTLLWCHVAAGFPTKETFTDAVRAGNYDCPDDQPPFPRLNRDSKRPPQRATARRMINKTKGNRQVRQIGNNQNQAGN
jgi:hypothetical protein